MEVRRISNDELYHHGIKGQKWGVRKQRELVGRQKRIQTISNDGVNSQKRQRTRSQRISDTLAKKKTQRIIGGVIGGLVAANVAMYGIGYYQKHSGKTKKMRVNSEEAKKKAKMAEEWYERIKNGQSYFDARNNLNYGNRTNDIYPFTFRKNRYSLPKFN